MGLVLFIVFALIAVIIFAINLYTSVVTVKSPLTKINYIAIVKKELAFSVAFAISFTMMLVSIYWWNNIHARTYQYLSTIFGGSLFAFSFSVGLNAFILHYYGKNIPESINKWLYRFMIIGLCLALITFFITTNGFAEYLQYPLANGLSFSEGFVNIESTASPNLAFYALCILGGAILVYFMCDHYLYIQYGRHGIVESTFLVAFPAGIIGARIGYVIGNFNLPRTEGGFDGVFDYHVFAIWEGGLTILSGALIGIIVGVIWYMWRNKGMSIWLAVDIIVPTILIAQGVGRWGNFFNCEVHGLESDVNNWKWLPEIIWRNAAYSDTNGLASEGHIYVPLFFIEGLVNFFGYFLLAHVFGIKFRKQTELGDLAFGYIVWYGLTRVFMEPLRNSSYNMGGQGYWSWMWALIFVFAGTLLIVLNHLIRFIYRIKHNEYFANKNSFKVNLTASIILGIFCIALLIVGGILMGGKSFDNHIAYSQFNVGFILLIIGLSILISLAIPLPKLFWRKKND